MVQLPTPQDVMRTAGGVARTLLRPVGAAATIVARRVLGIRTDETGVLNRVPDDLPRDTLFEQPLRVEVTPRDAEPADGGTRVTFRVVVRDAVGRRCPDLNVVARIDGPERSATGETTTDLMGGARFRMTGPSGRYAVQVLDVAAGALQWEAPNGAGAEQDIS